MIYRLWSENYASKSLERTCDPMSLVPIGSDWVPFFFLGKSIVCDHFWLRSYLWVMSCSSLSGPDWTDTEVCVMDLSLFKIRCALQMKFYAAILLGHFHFKKISISAILSSKFFLILSTVLRQMCHFRKNAILSILSSHRLPLFRFRPHQIYPRWSHPLSSFRHPSPHPQQTLRPCPQFLH